MNYKSIDAIVRRKFGTYQGITGLDYMEKIVQLSFQIPGWTKDDISQFMVFTLSNNISDTERQDEFLKNLDLLVTAVKRNPRDAKRFINTIILAKAMIDKPVDELIAVHALLYRQEWRPFLNFIKSDEKRREFFEEYISVKKTGHSPDEFQKRIIEKYGMTKIYSQFNKSDDPLVEFLDAGSARILHKIEDMNLYMRVLSATDLKQSTSATTILTDEPISGPMNDIKRYSESVTDIIKHSTPSFSVGIYGDWGSGKTTLMKMIENKLRENNNSILTIWFDAWQYENEAQFTLDSFVKKIAYVMDKNPIYKEIKLLLSKVEENNLSEVESRMHHIMAKFPTARVVVFIDNLDRCSPEKMIELFEFVKVFLSIAGFIFIIGLNLETNVVLNPKIQSKFGKNAEEYLRDIIQLPILIPKWDYSNIVSLVDKFSKTSDDKYRNVILENKDLIAFAVGSNPRKTKHFLNQFMLTSQLYPGNPRGLLVSLALKYRLSDDLYDDLMSNSIFREEVQKYLNMSKDERSKTLIDLQHDEHISAEVKKLVNIDLDLWDFLSSESDTIFGKDADDDIKKYREALDYTRKP